LCGHSFSAGSISRTNKSPDDELKKFATRHLDEEHPYLILDARCEKVREELRDAHAGSDNRDWY
jgi:putative transposase